MTLEEGHILGQYVESDMSRVRYKGNKGWNIIWGMAKGAYEE